MLRELAGADASLALVASMNPAVITSAGWLAELDEPAPDDDPWEVQRRQVFQTLHEGHWWGTVVSEPGSGGNPANTKSGAQRTDGGDYRISGSKHFGSGCGQVSYMITTAIADGETAPSLFFVDMRDIPWDGACGVTLLAEWDGHGMTATQSHSLHFEGFPATRIAKPCLPVVDAATRIGRILWTAVTVGIVESAVKLARQQLERKRSFMRAFEQVERAHVEMEAWLLQQAYQGILQTVEKKQRRDWQAVLAKTATAHLAESILLRICKVIGGGSYGRRSPFGSWLNDVRALGHLRPSWGLAYENILDGVWQDGAENDFVKAH